VNNFELDINGQKICGMRWGDDSDQLPTLALHGWLDNAASFSMLAPRLPTLQLWAIDLPGHGLSDHRRAPGAYNIWDDLLDILALADRLAWPRFNILAHSRGALIANLLAATMPERIARMVLIDGIWPMPVDAADAPSLLRQYLLDQRGYTQKKMSRYTSVDEAVEVRQKAAGLGAEAARLIVERGIRQRAEGDFCWRSDPRLTLASAFKLTEQHNRAFLEAITAPVLILLASAGFGRYPGVEENVQQYPNIECRILQGSHHIHMEAADVVAPLVEAFLHTPATSS
jgi:pimeloyl-ACP methyl ester carboxylesterase